MKGNPRHDHALIHLISEFEALSQEGQLSFLEEKDFFKIINYYENEFLLDKALEVADQALKQYGFSADFHLKKAHLLLAMRNGDLAMDMLEKAELFAPHTLDISLLKAKIFCLMEDYSSAMVLLNNAKAEADEEELSCILLCEAQVHERLKEYDVMFELLRESLIVDSKNEEALEKLWICTELTRRFKESIRFHKWLIDRDPYNYLAWYNLGHAYSCKGKYSKAISAYEYSFIINPDFEIGYRDCADLCYEICRYEDALYFYKETLNIFGPDSDLLANIGECYIQIQNFTEAEKFLKKASRLDPYNDEVFFYLGICHAREDRWLSAITSYFKAIEIEDRREEYYSNLALAFHKVGEFAKAHYYYLKATEVGPEQCSIWKEHVVFLIQIGETSKAMEVIEEAEYHAVGPELSYCKVACLFSIGDHDQALLELKECLEEAPSLLHLLFEMMPQLQENEKVKGLISYLIPVLE